MGFPVAMFDYTLKVPRRARQVRRGPEVLAKIVQDGGKQPGKLDCMGLTPRKIGSQLKLGTKTWTKHWSWLARAMGFRRLVPLIETENSTAI